MAPAMSTEAVREQMLWLAQSPEGCARELGASGWTKPLKFGTMDHFPLGMSRMPYPE